LPAGPARKRLTDARILEALKATVGQVYLAAERLGCAAGQIHARAQRSPRIARALDHYRGRLVDAAEAALWQQVANGQSWAVSLVLKTLGRSRGYGEAEPAARDQPKDAGPSVQELVAELLRDPQYLEFCRAQASLPGIAAPPHGADDREEGSAAAEPGAARSSTGYAGLLRSGCQPGSLEPGAASGGDRQGGDRDDSGQIGGHSGC
jgi:hypothetical protein